MLELILRLLATTACSLAASTMPGDATIHCVSEEYATSVGMEHAAGWYNGDIDEIFVIDSLTFQYTREVLAHELAHQADLEKGTRINGYPSFFSETHTGFDVEEWARMITYVNGDWPTNEVFPDAIPTQEDIIAMRDAGWLD